MVSLIELMFYELGFCLGLLKALLSMLSVYLVLYSQFFLMTTEHDFQATIVGVRFSSADVTVEDGLSTVLEEFLVFLPPVTQATAWLTAGKLMALKIDT